MKRAATAILLLATALPAAAEDGPVALTGATVHPVSGPAREKTDLVFAKGRIVSLGQPAPPGAERVDLTGLHLYPGLIDANTVLGLVEIGSVKGTIDDAEVGRINPNLRAELGVNPDSELLAVARTGGVLSALTRPSRGLIAGRSAAIALSGWTWEDMTLRAPVFLHVRWPAMTLDRSGRSKTTVDDQRDAREEALAELDEALAEARAYLHARKAPDAQPLPRDPKWEAMAAVVRGELPVAIDANGLPEVVAALDWVERQEVRAVLVGGRDAWRATPRLKELQVPVVLGRVFSRPRDHEAVDTAYRVAGRLHAAGVPFAFSTGASSFAAANARNLRDHAALATGHGLPEDAALHGLTLGAARILGVDAQLGSLEPGKLATLIATDGPLFDHRTRVVRAWIAGKEVSLVDRQKRLYERYRSRPR